MNNPAGPGREARLRARIDVLTDERDDAIVRLERYQKRTRRRCVYCGDRIRAQAIACGSHKDLLLLDPYYLSAGVRRRELAA